MNEGWARIIVGLAIGLLTIVTSCEMLMKRMEADKKANPPRPVGARVEKLTGEVLHVHLIAGIGEGPDKPATPGLAVRDEDQFKVPPGETCTIRSATGALIELAGPGTSRGFARFEGLSEDGKSAGLRLMEGRVAIAATPDQSWTIQVYNSDRNKRTRTVATGTGGTVSGEYNLDADQFRLVVKDGTASVKESDLTTLVTKVPAGQQYTGSADVFDKPGPMEPAPSDALDKLADLQRKQQEKPAKP